MCTQVQRTEHHVQTTGNTPKHIKTESGGGGTSKMRRQDNNTRTREENWTEHTDPSSYYMSMGTL